MALLSTPDPSGDLTTTDFDWGRAQDFEWSALADFDWGRVLEDLRAHGVDFELSSIGNLDWGRLAAIIERTVSNPSDHPALPEPNGDVWFMPIWPGHDMASTATADTGEVTILPVWLSRDPSHVDPPGGRGAVLDPTQHPALLEPVPGELPPFVGAGQGVVSAGGFVGLYVPQADDGWIL